MSPSKASEKDTGEISNSHTTSSETFIPQSANAISNVGENKASKKDESAIMESPLKSEDVSLGKVHDVDRVDGVDKVNGEEEKEDQEETHEYISGYKILVIMTAITLTTFLALLDTTIVATVSSFSLAHEGVVHSTLKFVLDSY